MFHWHRFSSADTRVSSSIQFSSALKFACSLFADLPQVIIFLRNISLPIFWSRYICSSYRYSIESRSKEVSFGSCDLERVVGSRIHDTASRKAPRVGIFRWAIFLRVNITSDVITRSLPLPDPRRAADSPSQGIAVGKNYWPISGQLLFLFFSFYLLLPVSFFFSFFWLFISPRIAC